MSTTLTAYAIDLDELTAAAGSKDEALVADVLAAFGDDLACHDDDDPWKVNEGDPPLPLTADALRAIVMGGPTDDRAGYKYGAALEALVRHLGEELPNQMWCSIRWTWLRLLDKALTEAGVPQAVFSTTLLTARGSPVPIPPPSDFPGIGHLTPAEVRAALAAFDGADWSKVTVPEAIESLEEARGWLMHCAAAGRGLICFYA